MALRCSGLYLAQYRRTNPALLATGDGPGRPAIVGDVYVHPSAKIHPTAKVSRAQYDVPAYRPQRKAGLPPCHMRLCTHAQI